MINHILVPLDGSPLAESSLPMAAFLAQVFAARVTLVHIIEKNPPEEIHGQPHLKNADEAFEYLDTISRRFFSDKTIIESHVHTEETTEISAGISDHVGELHSDLIVMCTHGRGGLRDLVFGNNAQQVISMGKTPVVVIPQPEDIDNDVVIRRILVPLDGQPEHEQGLSLAAEFALACKASLHLLTIVPTFDTLPGKWSSTGRLLPGTTDRMLDMSVSQAIEYLDEHRSILEKKGLAVTIDVFRGHPAGMINRAVETMGMNLVVIGTLGRGGTRAFWTGSEGSRICCQCRLPILLVPWQNVKS
nr:universal stress protein [candidate division Zixibacteria bacterium]